MAAASEAMYKHLWIPKRTARDWGKTDYHVIRNWTPRVPQSASDQRTSDHLNSSPDQPAEHNDIIDQDPDEVEEESGLTAPSSLRSLERERGTGTNSEEERDEPVSQLVATGRKRARASGSSGSVSKRSRVSVNVASGSVGVAGGLGGEGAGGTVGKDANTVDGLEELGAVGTSMMEKRALRSAKRDTCPATEQQTSSHRQYRARERRSALSEPARLVGEGREEERDRESDSEPDINEREEDEKSVKTARRKGSKGAAKTSSFKLWQSHYQRNGRDLNELDICFSVYDSVMRDAINDGAATPIVQRTLIEHWKITKKHVLSTIRDLSIVSALEKKHRQEVTKYRKLQKESLATLKSLRQINGQYLQAVSRARSSRHARKLSVEQSEVEELSSELAAYLAKLKSHP